MFSTDYTYDDDINITNKAYSFTAYGMSLSINLLNEYDEKGRITATGFNQVDRQYIYDKDSQLSRVNDDYYKRSTRTYSYDGRGNILSKNTYSYTENENITSSPNETTVFEYANNGWQDQLTAVNGIPLTYDANGNVLSYGDKSYTWINGRNLESITDGNNTYSYTYDENGIRTSKTIDGVTTYYNTQNGVILSQTDGTNTMYFQYDIYETPIGFIYNGNQYFYLTNQTGDVFAVAYSDGTLIAEYIYDEWGKVIDTYMMVEDNEEWTEAVNANPLRYRGYYYDTETGYYYLQSRYYDPSICRFINADAYEYAKIQKNMLSGTNLFAYCNNNAINNSDCNGHLTKIDAAVDLVVFLVYFVAPCILKDKKGQYNFEASKIFIDPTGLCIAKIKYYKPKSSKKSFQVVLGDKKDWGNRTNINNNLNMTTINYHANNINSLMTKAGTGNFTTSDGIQANIYSFYIACYLISAGIKTASINSQYQKLWGKYTGIFANSKKNVILCQILKGGSLNGWYYFY